MTQEELDLERTKHGCQMFVELSKAQIEFSAKALQGLFILNGGAATAVIATKTPQYSGLILLFALGALAAALGMGAGYFANGFIGDTWRAYIEDVDNWKAYHKDKEYKGKIWKGISVSLAVASALLFAIALVVFCCIHTH